MRWGLRYQLLIPPILLLLAVVGITTWTALARPWLRTVIQTGLGAPIT